MVRKHQVPFENGNGLAGDKDLIPAGPALFRQHMGRCQGSMPAEGQFRPGGKPAERKALPILYAKTDSESLILSITVYTGIFLRQPP
jgi:hypothetical protein